VGGSGGVWGVCVSAGERVGIGGRGSKGEGGVGRQE